MAEDYFAAYFIVTLFSFCPPCRNASVISSLRLMTAICRRPWLAALVLVCPALSAQDQAAPGDSANRIVGYYTSWSVYDRGFEVAQVRGEHLTHLNYAFAKIVGGKCVPADPWADGQRPTKTSPASRGNFQALQRLKRKHPHLKTLISVGGWTLSGPFSDVARTAASRKQFAASCVDFIQRHQFDGVDLDWEYPVEGGKPGIRSRPEDKRNYTRLLSEMRRQLDDYARETKRPCLLTIACGARPELLRNLEVSAIVRYVDWVNVMAYDFHGSWSRLASFHSPLFHPQDAPKSIDGRLSAHAAIQTLINAGAPREKIVLGVPFYGRGWKGVSATNNGLFQKPRGAMASQHEPGLIPYREMLRRSGFTQFSHAQAQASWGYNATTKELVVYDNQLVIEKKAQYINKQRLGGVMVWELGHDALGERSLLTTLSRKLRR